MSSPLDSSDTGTPSLPASSPSSSSSSSFFLPPEPVLTPPELGDEIDSLPSTSDDAESTITTDSSDELYHRGSGAHSDAEKQWRESLQQLELLLTMVVVPYIGKYFGRKAAYWGWAKYMEWMYPVKVVISDKGAFRAAGIIGAASAL